MKRTFYLILFLTLSIFSSCRKDNSTKPSGTNLSNSYYPVGKGTEWHYRTTTGNTVTNSTDVVTGLTTTINNQTYYECTSTMDLAPPTKSYIYSSNGVYRIRSTTMVYGITIEFEHLRENAAVGESWIAQVTESGTVNGVPARIKVTIKEKNITKIVRGKTYSNVIHSTMELQYDMLGNGFETSATYELYSAKGVGIIQVEALIDFLGLKTESKTELINYTIK